MILKNNEQRLPAVTTDDLENMIPFKKVVLAPHDDGSGAFAVLFRLARALLHVANKKGSALHLYFLNSSVAADGQVRLASLLQGMCDTYKHRAILVPTDNLIWLPKDRETAAVIGERIPDLLRKWVHPLWNSWPSTPNWILSELPVMSREEWIGGSGIPVSFDPRQKWNERKLARWGTGELVPEFWRDVSLGISMGVPQLHRAARREGFPSIEVGDWFFSVGLRGCMQESGIRPETIAMTEPVLKMIEEDEFKANEAWLTLYQSPHREYKEHLANSPVKFNEMDGLLWTGDPAPNLATWELAINLKGALMEDLISIRRVPPKCLSYIVPGTTPVWHGILEALRQRKITGEDEVAILDLNRGRGTVSLLEGGRIVLSRASDVLQSAHTEEMHLALCRASDLGITRTAGGILGFVETQRPSILVDEPGHWLGRIQRDQCHAAGLCVVVPIHEFLSDPAGTIRGQSKKLNTGSDLDRIADHAGHLKVGVEQELAEYLFRTYIE